MNRREFLKSLTLGTGAVAFSNGLLPRSAHAAINTNDYVIFCEMQGAWDLQLCLDTRDPAIFTAANVPQTRIELGWDLLPARFQNIVRPNGSSIVFGPAMSSFAQNHFDKSCVVRGLNMETLSHVVGQRYFITGKRPAGEQPRGGSMGAVFAEQALPLLQAGQDVPEIPNLVVDTEAFYDGNSNLARPWRMGGQNAYELYFALRDGIGDAIPDAALAGARVVLDPYRENYAICDPTGRNRNGLLSAILASQIRAREIVKSDLSRHFGFTNLSDPEVQMLRSDFNFTRLGTPGSQAAIAYQAIKYGISQFVTIRLQADLDTHNDRWYREQPILLEEGFNALDALVNKLGATQHSTITSDSLLDHTTIVVFSDFSRTPMLNNLNGRDHSLLNACLLIGNKVPHNRVIGGSSDVGMSPLAVNPTTGIAIPAGGNETGVTLNPELVLGAVMRNLGYDPSELRVTGTEVPALNV
jgi:uncharacterized protein (DUF1501 family)